MVGVCRIVSVLHVCSSSDDISQARSGRMGPR